MPTIRAKVDRAISNAATLVIVDPEGQVVAVDEGNWRNYNIRMARNVTSRSPRKQDTYHRSCRGFRSGPA